LTGRVFDGSTEEGLSGARIEFHPLVRTKFDELVTSIAEECEPR